MFVLQLFDSKSPLMAALGELLDWFLLSLLTWICSVPVITAGPAWAALYGVMSNRIGDNSPLHSAAISPTSGAYSVLRLPTGCSFLLQDVFCSTEFYIVGKMPSKVRTLFWAGVIFLAFCLILTEVFLVPLLCAKPMLPCKQLWKAAFIQGIARLPQSLKILSALLFPGILFLFSEKWFWLLLPVWVFFWPAAFAWLWSRTDCLAAIRYAKSALISWEFESFKPI